MVCKGQHILSLPVAYFSLQYQQTKETAYVTEDLVEWIMCVCLWMWSKVRFAN